MDTFTAITERRAIKSYDPNFVIPAADEKKLFEHVLLAPTSFNIQNWRFVVVRDASLKKSMRAAAWNQAQVEEASLTIVVCGDIKAWEKSPERYWRNAPEASRNALVPMIGQFYTNAGEQVQRDEVMRSAGLAAQTLMLGAKALGYDSGPMIGFDPAEVAKLINLPNDHAIAMIVVVGKALKPAYARGGQLPMEEVIFTDRFPS